MCSVWLGVALFYSPWPLPPLGGRGAHENHRRGAAPDSVYRRPAGLHRPGKRLLPRKQYRCRRRVHPRRRRERASGGFRRRPDRPRHRHPGGDQRVREKSADQNRRRRDHRHGRLLVRAEQHADAQNRRSRRQKSCLQPSRRFEPHGGIGHRRSDQSQRA